MITKKRRADKAALIERERQFAANTLVDAAQAKNVSLVEQAYLQAARWFESNVAQQERKATRSWKRLSGLFGAIAILALIALAGLTPLKTVDLRLLRVDNASGYTDVRPISEAKAPDRVEDEYWLASYVRFRESYNFSANDANYAMVELMSYDDAFGEYKNFQLSSKGYLEQLGTNRQIRTDVININPLPRVDPKTGTKKGDDRTYQVRYTKTVLDKNGVPDPQLKPTTWLTTITFDYGKKPKNAGDQWSNFRGFGVLAYQPTQEFSRGK